MAHVLKYDGDNYMLYNLAGEHVIMNYMVFNDCFNLTNIMRFYYDFFANLPGFSFLGSFPGVINPVVVKAGLDVIKERQLDYRIYYDTEEIINTKLFENSVLMPTVRIIQSDSISKDRGIKQSVCKGPIFKQAEALGFKHCAVYSSLKVNVEVQIPIRYYRIENGIFTREYNSKPDDDYIYYKSVNLHDRFKKHTIKIADGKLEYLPKM